MGPALTAGGPLKYLLWTLIPLLLLLLIWLEGPQNGRQQRTDAGSAAVQSHSGEAQWVQLPSADGKGDLSSGYIAPSENRRARVLQNLSEFRAAYKQLAPFVEVRAPPGLESRQMLARRLGGALSHYGLGRVFDDPHPAGEGRTLVVLRGAEQHAEILRRLLAALSPYLAGKVLVQFDDSLRIDQIGLYLMGEPRFNEEGVAVFGTAE